MKKQKYPLVLVVWSDANTVGGWQAPKELKPVPTRSVTVGWLLEEHDHYLVIFSSYNADGDISDATTIPGAWIVEKKVLRGNAATIKEKS